MQRRSYTGQQRNLIKYAKLYLDLGYCVGLTAGKDLAYKLFDSNNVGSYVGESWDGISLVLGDDLVCVDFDTPVWRLGPGHMLPPTLKERSRRGMHLFYRIPPIRGTRSQIGWKPGIDLLVGSGPDTWRKSKYNDYADFDGHVLVSPTQGYTRVWPEATPEATKLPVAPDWLVEELVGADRR